MFPSAGSTWRIKMRKPTFAFLLIFTLAASLVYAADPRFIINSGHTEAVSEMDYLSADNLLITGSYDGTIKVWSGKTARIEYQLQVSHMPVRKLAADRSGPYVAAVVSDGINSVNLSVWNWQTGQMLFRHRIEEIPLFVKFSPNGTFLVYGKTDFDSLVFLDARKGTGLDLIPEGFGIVSSVFISQSEKTLLTYNSSGSIQYWDLTNGSRKTRISTVPNLEHILFSSNGRYMTGYNGREMLLIDLLKGNKLGSVPAEALADSSIDQSSDKLFFATKSTRGIKINSVSISGTGFTGLESSEIRNFQPPVDIIASNNRLYTAYESGAVYVQDSQSGGNPEIFSKNNLLEINDFAINETALAITAPGKLLSISSDFFSHRTTAPDDPEAATKTTDINPDSRFGISAGKDSEFLLWESESATGGSIRVFNSTSGDLKELTKINAPLISAEFDSNKLLTLNKNGDCRIIDYASGKEEFKYSSFGLRTVDFIDGRNIIAGRNSTSTLNTPLLHINTLTGETVPVEDNDLLVFDLEYDELTRKLYTLGFEDRNGVMRTVLKQHTGKNHDRAETLLAYPGEDIGSSFASDSGSSKIFTSLGYGGVKMLYWGGFTSLETDFSIPKTLKLSGNLLAALNLNSSLTIYNPSNGAKVMDLFIFEDLSWAAFLSSNKIYASEGADKYINIYNGDSDQPLRKSLYMIN